MKSQTPSRLSTNQLLTGYLKSKGYSSTSVESYQKSIGYFEEWLRKENLRAEEVSYQDGLAYLQYLKKKGLAQRSIHHYLIGVNHYYEYEVSQRRLDQNPIARLKVKEGKKKKMYQIIESHELHRMYGNYRAESLSERRDKVLLGLLIYQGLRTGDIYRLEVKDVKLKEGMIEIGADKQSNERTLQLESHQVMEMHEYVMQARPELLKQSGEETELLFVGSAGGQSPGHYVARILKKLRKLQPNLTAQQIRASVIVKWLKRYNLRKAQYLSGHKHVSSTESYLQNEMEGLKEEIEQFHPLG